MPGTGFGLDSPWISAAEHVANTQQETLSMTAILPQMQAISAGPQLPKLLPKQFCCNACKYTIGIKCLQDTYSALRDLTKGTLC